MLALYIILSYLVLSLCGARFQFRKLRPLTEPLNCDKGILCNYGRGPHYHTRTHNPCYRSPAGDKLYIDSDREAAAFSLLMGVGWPVIFAASGLVWCVTAGNRAQQPAEMEARIAELEKELGL